MINEIYSDKRIKVNPLYKIYRDVRDKMIIADNIYNQNITSLFYEYLVFQIKTNKLLNIAVIGEVAHGKSTLACGLCNDIISYINKFIYKDDQKNYKKMSVNQICADTLEWSRKAHDNKYSNTCFVVDEDNPMSKVGVNSTTEIARLQSFSRIQAQRFIHRIYCAPGSIADDQSTIILQVINYDKNYKFIRANVWYKSNEPYGNDMQIIGFTDVYVSDILEKEWYKKYKIKKFKKMDLINEAGIDDVRQFEEAIIIMELYSNNCALAKYQMLKISDLNLEIKQIIRENKSRVSLLAKDEFIKDIKAILDNVYYTQKQLILLEKWKNQKKEQQEKENKIDENEILFEFAITYLITKIEKNQKQIDLVTDTEWIQKLFNLNDKDTNKIINIIFSILNNKLIIDNEKEIEIKKNYPKLTKLINIIAYRYNLMQKLKKDIVYYTKTIDYYNEYKKISENKEKYG